ncbi:PKD domain-containing protein [Fulvivirga sp. 29W222]|uniref:PKD domain-containing protein n=1 Tax=Fulvivirga marina TaxID=2494733 RepID=A0A937FZ75_9BACT|nr:PKD domain-containing protein [Fulvivirga marina]MBL6448709.1 PKD domain-containing protein [Fulvivirga marina]
MNRFLIAVLLFFSWNTSFGQDLWPFRNASGNVIRGNISGTVGDWRGTGWAGYGGARFHSGVDFTSTLTGAAGRAVYSMHAGTATVINNGDCWNDFIQIRLADGSDVYYKHIRPSSTDPVTGLAVTEIRNGSTVAVGTFLGLMITGESCNQHLHLNDNSDPSSSLPGTTNFLNNFLTPFTDSHAPDFMGPFNVDGNIIQENSSNDAVEIRSNGHRHDFDSQVLTDEITISNETHKVVYKYIDIISRMRDRHILSTGAGSNGGNNGINAVSYEILSGATSLTGEIENINFNNVPNNIRAQYIYDTRSVIGAESRHVYILTGHPHLEPYDRFFNTRLRIGQIEDWDLSNRGNKDARGIAEAEFPDGKYVLRIRAKDISNNTNTDPNITVRDAKIFIDNFRPYIERVEVATQFGNLPITKYEGEWVPNAASGILDFSELNEGTISPFYDIKVTVTASEPLRYDGVDNPVLQIDGISNPNLTAVSADRKQFTFTIPAYTIAAGDVPEERTLNFTGLDLAGNALVAFDSEDSDVSYTAIPPRNADGTWPTAGIIPSGTDTRHSIIIDPSGSCWTSGGSGGRVMVECDLVASFTHSTNESAPLTVQFTDLSVPANEIIGWKWDFGDGYTSTSQHPMHTYANIGVYTVSLTVSSATEQSTYIQAININMGGSISSSFSATPSQGAAPLRVDLNSSASVGDFFKWSVSPNDGYRYVLGNSTYRHPSIEFTKNGTYTITLTVSNSYQQTATYSRSIIVAPEGGPPTVDFSWNGPVYANTPVSFRDESLVNCVNGVSYYWYFKEGFFEGTSTVENPDWVFQNPGTYEVIHKVTDGCGKTSTLSKFITVEQALPPSGINASYTQSARSVFAGESINFVDFSYVPSNVTLSYSNWFFQLPITWTKGSQVKGAYQGYSGGTVAHTYDQKGKYKTALILSTEAGNLFNDDYHEDIITVYPREEGDPYDNLRHTITTTNDQVLASDYDEDILVVAINNSNNFQRVKIYEGETLEEAGYFLPSTTSETILDVAVHGKTIAVATTSSLYVYKKIAGSWDKVKIGLRDIYLEDWTWYTPPNKLRHVDVYNDRIVVNDKGDEYNVGELRVFQRIGGSWTNYTEILNFDLSAYHSIYELKIHEGTIAASLYAETGAKSVMVFSEEIGWNSRVIYSGELKQGKNIDLEYRNLLIAMPTGGARLYMNSIGWYSGMHYVELKHYIPDNSRVHPHVSISGNYIVSVANEDVILYVKPRAGWTNMVEQGKLTTADWIKDEPGSFAFVAGDKAVFNGGYGYYKYMNLGEYCDEVWYEKTVQSYTSGQNINLLNGAMRLGGDSNGGQYLINSGANVNLTATKWIQLKPGFEAKAGSQVKINTETCENVYYQFRYGME